MILCYYTTIILDNGNKMDSNTTIKSDLEAISLTNSEVISSSYVNISIVDQNGSTILQSNETSSSYFEINRTTSSTINTMIENRLKKKT